MRRIQFLLLAGLLAVLLAGCKPSQTPLAGEEQDAVLTFSESMTDNLLSGMNDGDYAAFSRDFDQDMLNAINQAQFDAMKKDRDAKLGLYISREVSSVIQQGDFYVVIYTARFELEETVTVRVVFRVADPHQVSGLWFDK